MKFIFFISFIFFSNLSNAQSRSIFVKLISEKNNNRYVRLYANTKNISQATCLIGSKNFCQLACDSFRKVEIFSDVLKYENKPYFSFKIPGKFQCGDSIVVNIDTGITKYISQVR